jgi:hypothetical protein
LAVREFFDLCFQELRYLVPIAPIQRGIDLSGNDKLIKRFQCRCTARIGIVDVDSFPPTAGKNRYQPHFIRGFFQFVDFDLKTEIAFVVDKLGVEGSNPSSPNDVSSIIIGI